MNSASIYRAGNRIVVCAHAADEDTGVPVDCEPFVVYEEPVNPADVGGAIARFLAEQDESAGKVTDAGTARDFSDYLAQILGYENYREFLNNAQTCVVEQADDAVVARPVDPAVGDRDDWEAYSPGTEPTSEALGSYLLSALHRAG
ncbi:MAG: hypothetical protein AAFO79_03850 [Pseudomonadota bacterium]